MMTSESALCATQSLAARLWPDGTTLTGSMQQLDRCIAAAKLKLSFWLRES